jgi:hypothetical protein
VKDSDSIDEDKEKDMEGTWKDPRFSQKALAARNVDLIFFELV